MKMAQIALLVTRSLGASGPHLLAGNLSGLLTMSFTPLRALKLCGLRRCIHDIFVHDAMHH